MSDAVPASEAPRVVGSPQWCARLLRATLDDSLTLTAEALEVSASRLPGAPRTVVQQYGQAHEHGNFLGAVVLQSKIDMERSIRAVADLVTGIITLFEAGG